MSRRPFVLVAALLVSCGRDDGRADPIGPRERRAPVLAHWVEARASRSWPFALTLAP